MKKIMEPSFSEECMQSSFQDIEEDRCDNLAFQKEECSVPLMGREFYECTFSNVVFHSEMGKMLFADVIFDHCDLSNEVLCESVFRRVVFDHCRLMGSDFSGCTMQDTVMKECQGDYSNFSSAKMKDCAWNNVHFAEGSFAMMTIKNLSIQECDFTHSEWNDTKMIGLDFSDSVIDGIAVNAECLKGVIVNAEQAVSMAKLLGIVVK